MADWTPKLVAVDADGTIVAPDETIPPALADKLRQIDAAGVPIVLATGRAWLSAQRVLDQLNLPQIYCVCNNGATVVTYPPLAIVASTTFDPAPVIAVVRDYPTTVIAIEDFGRGYLLSRSFPPGLFPLHGDHTVVSFDQLAARPASRLILRDAEASPAEFDAMVARLDLSGLSFIQGSDNWLDVAAGEAGKENGLAIASAALGVDRRDVLAFGDGDNDVTMLEWAGRGVALGDAPAQLQAVADAVSPTFADGGILAELEYWFG